jgi:hypothetical protein
VTYLCLVCIDWVYYRPFDATRIAGGMFFVPNRTLTHPSEARLRRGFSLRRNKLYGRQGSRNSKTPGRATTKVFEPGVMCISKHYLCAYPGDEYAHKSKDLTGRGFSSVIRSGFQRKSQDFSAPLDRYGS